MLPGHALVWTLKGAATSSFASNVRPTHLLLAPANPTTMPNRNNLEVCATPETGGAVATLVLAGSK
jgi:hypothetical protein